MFRKFLLACFVLIMPAAGCWTWRETPSNPIETASAIFTQTAQTPEISPIPIPTEIEFKGVDIWKFVEKTEVDCNLPYEPKGDSFYFEMSPAEGLHLAIQDDLLVVTEHADFFHPQGGILQGESVKEGQGWLFNLVSSEGDIVDQTIISKCGNFIVTTKP